ncbi:MAG: NUDIX domain-containing protein [Phycisphaerales bacterium]|nr:NUDIX domain-containing protein [Phycisphaerales bacterium]
MSTVVARIIDVYVFRRDADAVRFLLLRRAPTLRLGGTWQSVHGRIEAGESAAGAALRELREETGLAPTRFWQLEFVNMFYVADSDEVHCCPTFAAEVAAGATVALSHEHTDHRWETAEDAKREMLWPGQRRAIEEIEALILGVAACEPHLRISGSF